MAQCQRRERQPPATRIPAAACQRNHDEVLIADARRLRETLANVPGQQCTNWLAFREREGLTGPVDRPPAPEKSEQPLDRTPADPEDDDSDRRPRRRHDYDLDM
jgi:hypothetical protein